MKEKVSPPALVAIVVVVVLVLGLIGWKVFGPDSTRIDPAQSAITRAKKEKNG